jgi:hypothetical protein
MANDTDYETARLEVLKDELLKSQRFCDVKPCRLVTVLRNVENCLPNDTP